LTKREYADALAAAARKSRVAAHPWPSGAAARRPHHVAHALLG